MLSYKEIPNYFSFQDLYDEVVLCAPDNAVFIEVGTWFGASAAYLGMKIQESGKQIKVFAVDNFTAEGSGPVLLAEAAKVGGNFLEIFRRNMELNGVAGIVTPIAGDSTATADQFEDASVDFVFIDACHEYQKVKQDILAWLPKIKTSGIIAGHDYDKSHPGVRQVVNEVFHGRVVRHIGPSWLVELDRNRRQVRPRHNGKTACP